MSLEILLILVIGGISAIAVLLHMSGRSNRVVLMPEDARAEWHRHFPDDMIRDVIVSHDGHAALVQTDEGPGLLWSFGADTVGRHLLDFDLIESSGGFDIHFHDFTAPHVSLTLDEAERREWQSLMQPT